MNELFARLKPIAHPAMRIAIGFMFWTHGAQKLFGWFGRYPAELMSRLGVAGVLEFFGGIAIMLGLFTQPIAFILAGEMAVAYFWIHVIGRDSLWPWANGGERAAMYGFIFLALSAWGSGGTSLDGVRGKHRLVDA